MTRLLTLLTILLTSTTWSHANYSKISNGSDSLVRQARVLLRRSTELTRTLTAQRDAALLS